MKKSLFILFLLTTAGFLSAQTQQPVAKTYTNSIGMKFVRIPAGSFTMGSDYSVAFNYSKPTHQVTISRAFEMQTTEVTQAQWKALIGRTVSDQRDLKGKSYYLNGEGDDYPIYFVSWIEVQEFIRKLNNLDPGKNYRLPTEAEWEYTCRAGTTGNPFLEDFDKIAWYDYNSGNKTHPVGIKQPNAWGLYDMLGNVWEWCSDRYDNYTSGSVTDPTGPSTGSYRVFRGGDFHNTQGDATFTVRRWEFPTLQSGGLGFRLARSVE